MSKAQVGISWLTVEELYDVSEVHIVRQDYVSIVFKQRQCQEQNKVTRCDVLSRPYAFPHREDISVEKFTLKVQEKPTIAEVEVSEVSVGVHQVVHFRIEDLNERAHVGKVHVLYSDE